MKKLQHTLTCFNDPSLKHIDHGIYAWIITCILVGIILSSVLPDFGCPDDKYLRGRARPSQRSTIPLRQMRSYRLARRKVA